MIRRPPRSTQSRSSAASDVYKRQIDHASLSRRSTVPTPNRDTSNIWALTTFCPYVDICSIPVRQTQRYLFSTQAELERQRAEEQRKAEENSGKLDAKEKEALLEQFKRDQVLRCIYCAQQASVGNIRFSDVQANSTSPPLLPLYCVGQLRGYSRGMDNCITPQTDDLYDLFPLQFMI